VPHKRKSPEIKTRKITKAELDATRPPPPPEQVKIRCIYDSRLIISEDKTVSGRKYEFMTGQVKLVDDQDYEYLLAMETKPDGCCGGTIKPQKFFEEV
jgi:hypothetical protein